MAKQRGGLWNPKAKVLFVRIPKAGGRSIRQYLLDCEFEDDPGREATSFPDGWIAFGMMRDPVERYWSAAQTVWRTYAEDVPPAVFIEGVRAANLAGPLWDNDGDAHFTSELDLLPPRATLFGMDEFDLIPEWLIDNGVAVPRGDTQPPNRIGRHGTSLPEWMQALADIVTDADNDIVRGQRVKEIALEQHVRGGGGRVVRRQEWR